MNSQRKSRMKRESSNFVEPLVEKSFVEEEQERAQTAYQNQRRVQSLDPNLTETNKTAVRFETGYDE